MAADLSGVLNLIAVRALPPDLHPLSPGDLLLSSPTRSQASLVLCIRVLTPTPSTGRVRRQPGHDDLLNRRRGRPHLLGERHRLQGGRSAVRPRCTLSVRGRRVGLPPRLLPQRRRQPLAAPGPLPPLDRARQEQQRRVQRAVSQPALGRERQGVARQQRPPVLRGALSLSLLVVVLLDGLSR